MLEPNVGFVKRATRRNTIPAQWRQSGKRLERLKPRQIRRVDWSALATSTDGRCWPQPAATRRSDAGNVSKILSEWVPHYQRERNHQGLGNELIEDGGDQRRTGRVRRREKEFLATRADVVALLEMSLMLLTPTGSPAVKLTTPDRRAARARATLVPRANRASRSAVRRGARPQSLQRSSLRRIAVR
jgi:hypothetical protein